MIHKPGQILLELVLALGVSLLALMAVIQVTTKSITTAGFSKSKSEASTYAIAGTEWLRVEKKLLGWTAFAAKAGQTYCLNNLPPAWPGAGACSASSYITGTIYQRQVNLTTVVNQGNQGNQQGNQGNQQGNQVQAVVTVTWQEAIGSNVGTFSSKQTTLFTKY